jgi:hypothetical protein
MRQRDAFATYDHLALPFWAGITLAGVEVPNDVPALDRAAVRERPISPKALLGVSD